MGNDDTRTFYDTEGWREREGRTVDNLLFGVKEDGPIRIELYELHISRIRNYLRQAGVPLNLLECGCGGNPEDKLYDICREYTGVDFSGRGLAMAKAELEEVGLTHALYQADVCNLPFGDESFDAVYCGHMIYHIPDPCVQQTALKEIVRVIRPGGMAVIVAANPYPLLFPLRLARRLLADAPLLGNLFQKVRPKPPVPYKPMSIRWTRKRLERLGGIEMVAGSIPSTWFNQNVSEYQGLGKRAWRMIRWVDLKHPRLSTYLGNYVIYAIQKPGSRSHVSQQS